MRKILTSDFFKQNTLKVAKKLLGKYLVRSYCGKTTAYKITEVEAYAGHEDKASHASRGMTKRNKIMFGHPGFFYVYLTYGMHWMLNIVTESHGYPAAILIRGVEGISGPGRLTKKLHIGKWANGKRATRKTKLWFEDRGVKVQKIKSTPRIGVDYAGEWAKVHRRFVVIL